MALDLSQLRSVNTQGRRSWHGAAFIVESLALLAFLVTALAVVIQLMGVAHERGVEASHLSNAILASNDAEAFAADPTSGSSEAQFTEDNGTLVSLEEATAEAEAGADAGADGAGTADGETGTAGSADAGATVYRVERTVSDHAEAAGTLYEAHIQVSSDGEVLYELDTARYVSEGVAR